MCLGIPGQIMSVSGTSAVVDFWGTRRAVAITTLEEPVAPGDYVINHAGLAVRRIADADVIDTLAMYENVLAEAGEDPIEREFICERELLEAR